MQPLESPISPNQCNKIDHSNYIEVNIHQDQSTEVSMGSEDSCSHQPMKTSLNTNMMLL